MRGFHDPERTQTFSFRAWTDPGAFRTQATFAARIALSKKFGGRFAVWHRFIDLTQALSAF
jgi:hypothetical protein